MEGKLETIGALWIKESRSGKGKFMSGEIQLEGKTGPRTKILVFKNQEKKDRQPDYRICRAEDRQPGEDDTPF